MRDNMRKAAFIFLASAAAVWAAGPEAAAPVPPAAVPAPAPTSADDGFVPPAAVITGPTAEEPSREQGEVVLLSSGEGGCTFEVKVPEARIDEVEAAGRRFERFSISSFLPAGDEGAPELLVRTVYVAAPPGADVSVAVERASFDVRAGVNLYPRPRLEVIERHGERTLGEVFTYNPRAYAEGMYPRKLAELAGQDVMRGYRLLAVVVYPYQYQPATATLKLVESVVVRVSFAGGVRRPNSRYPARPPEEGVFSRIVPALVLNWETASRWPFAGAKLPATDDGIWPNDFADKPALKVIVKDEALYRINYAELKSTGFPVDSSSPVNWRMFVGQAKRLPRDFNYDPPGLSEVPFYVAGQGDGRFDPTDYVEFYGHGCDFFETIPRWEGGSQRFSKHRFTRYNVYWLVADDVTGKRMAPAAVAPAGGAKPAYFWERIRLEEDNVDEGEGRPEIKEDEEYWYWRSFDAPVGPTPLTTFTLKDPFVGATKKSYFQMMVRRQEGYSSNGPHHTIVYLNSPDEGHIIFEKKGYTADTETVFNERFPSGILQDGPNRIYFQEKDDAAFEVDYLMFDHIELEYPRRYRAFQDYVHFSNPHDLTGKVLFEIKGFTTDHLVVYDVTRGRRLTAFDVKAESGEYTLRFTDQIPSGQCWYVAASPAAADRKPVDLYMDAGSRLRDVDENVSLAVVVYDGYYDNVTPLVNLRRAKGVDIAVARVTDVYDEYSWGLYDPGAIRSFVKDLYFKAIYRRGGELPDHLLLVGDAYLDHRDNNGKFEGRRLWREFGRNQVPTYLVYTSHGRAASDNFLVAMSNTRAPDLSVGRLAAPFDENIDAIVDKLVQYENHATNGPWNNRVVLVADNSDKDQPPGEGAGGNFTSDNEELERDFVPHGFETRKENVEWLNRRFPYKSEKDRGFDYMTRGERGYYVAKFMKPDFLKDFTGVIMHFAGHGGPQVWTHENLFAQHKGLPPTDDVYALENGPCLPVILQCSCSTAYFNNWWWEEGRPLDYGQCLSEYILHEPRNGGVAALGSTFLGTEGGQHDFLKAFYGHVFPGQKPRNAGVTLGEAHFVGKMKANDVLVRDTFVLLGDPSMVLATPRPGVKLTPDKNTVKRGARLKVAGTVPNNFNGRATVELFDRPYYFYSHDLVRNIYRDRLLTTADVVVTNGRFEATLVVPTVPVTPEPPSALIAGGGGDAGGAAIGVAGPAAPALEAASASEAGVPLAPVAATPYYGESLAPVAEGGVIYVKALAYGLGFRQTYVCDENVTVNVEGEVSSNDDIGPDIDIYFDDYSFRSGDPTGPSPTLIVELRDDSGILIARNVEAIAMDEKTFVPLHANIDNRPPMDLTYYYRPKIGDYRAGSARKEIALGEGPHKITVTAHDSLGNKSKRVVQCVVSGALALAEVMNCPNPFKADTYFTFVASSDVDSLVIKVYTATGRLIQKLEAGGLAAGYHTIRWDGRDRDGDPIANGVYFYKIVARAGDERVVVREKMFKLR